MVNVSPGREARVVFDHRHSGSSEHEWRTADGWAHVQPLDIRAMLRLIVVSAHPDDETLAAAGIICAAAERGLPVTVLVATDGEASHPDSTTWTPQRLSAARRRELGDAVGLLAPDAQVRFLGLPDGRLTEHRHALQEAVQTAVQQDTGPGVSRQGGTVPGSPAPSVRAAAGSPAEGTYVVAPWRGDGHTDHEAAGEVAAAVAAAWGVQLLEYPIWLWHWAAPQHAAVPWHVFNSFSLEADWLRRKTQALRMHTTQVQPLSDLPGDEVLLGPRILDHFTRDFESFITNAPVAGPGQEGYR